MEAGEGAASKRHSLGENLCSAGRLTWEIIFSFLFYSRFTSVNCSYSEFLPFMMPIYFILVRIALWCSFRPFLFHASLFSFPLSTTIPQTSTRFLFLTVRSPDRELYLGRKCISVPWCTYLWNFSAFFLNLSPVVPLPWVSLSSTGSNLIDREVTSQVTCVFWKIWHFCLFVPHICFSFFYSLQIWLNKWTKYALLCHIIGWKILFLHLCSLFLLSIFKVFK